MTVTLKFNTPVIPRTKRMWVVRPGSGYRLHKDFLENSRIYLEMPDLVLDETVNDLGYGSYVSNPSVKDLIRRNAHRTLVSQNLYRGQTLDVPGIYLLGNFADTPPKPPANPRLSKQFGATVGNLGRFIVQMDIGDYIVVPGRGGTRAAVSF